MKLYFCLVCLAAVGTLCYPGDIRMTRLSVVTASFSQRLYRKMQSMDVTSISSPISIHMALTNLAFGAGGDTWTEINYSLELNRFTGGIMKPHEAYHNLTQEYRQANTTEGTVLLASYLGVNSRAPILQKFDNNTRMYYPTQVSAFNLSDPLTIEQKISDHIHTQTRGHIKDIVPPGSITSGTEIVLANALYVASSWQKAFNKQDISNSYFYPSTGPSIQVDFLTDKYRTMRVKEFSGAKMGELPCVGNRYSMYFLMPKLGVSISDLEKSLTEGNNSKQLFEGLQQKRVQLSLPKFKVESTFEVSSTLKALGMVKACDQEQADFKALSRTSRLYITKHFHKAIMEVNENGTGLVPAATFAERQGFTFESFKLNKPFVFFFRDNFHKIILTQGKFVGK